MGETGRTPSPRRMSRREALVQFIAAEQRHARLVRAEAKRREAEQRRIERAWETRQRRFHRLYLLVTCLHCGAQVGEECDLPLNSTAAKHTARVVACQGGVTAPARTPSEPI